MAVTIVNAANVTYRADTSIKEIDGQMDKLAHMEKLIKSMPAEGEWVSDDQRACEESFMNRKREIDEFNLTLKSDLNNMKQYVDDLIVIDAILRGKLLAVGW
jgi:hypothetical protein